MLTWDVDGQVSDAVLDMIGPWGEELGRWDVRPEGGLPVEVGETGGVVTFRLTVWNASGSDSESRTVTVLCSQTWFFSPAPGQCPDGPPVTGLAAYQRFERGHMFWFGPDGMITVLYEDGGIPMWERVPDRFEEGMPEYDPAVEPPTGFYRPVRGFGLVWMENPGTRERLGWALGPEEGFEGTRQTASVDGNPVILGLTDPDGMIYVLGPDGWWRAE